MSPKKPTKAIYMNPNPTSLAKNNDETDPMDEIELKLMEPHAPVQPIRLTSTTNRTPATKKQTKRGNAGRTKRLDITPPANTTCEKKMKRGTTPDVMENKPQHQTTADPTTTITSTTKHKRAYLLKERERRRTQRERMKEQTEPTRPITGTEGVQEVYQHTNQVRKPQHIATSHAKPRTGDPTLKARRYALELNEQKPRNKQ